MRNDQSRVKRFTNSVTGEVSHHSIVEAFCVRLNCSTNDVDLAPWESGVDATHHCFVSAFNQIFNFGSNFSHHEGLIAVSVKAIFERGDVNVDDVTFLKHSVVGDSMANYFVHR